MCRWEKDEEERRIKEEGKREKTALATWRKLLMGLRIIQRVREEYGGDADAHMAEAINPFTNPSRAKKTPQADAGTGSTPEGGPITYGNEEDIGGGFLVDDHDPDCGGLSPEGRDAVEVRHRAGELAIEGEKGLNGSLSANSDGKNPEPLRNDDCQGPLIELDLEGKAIVSSKASTNGRKAATTIAGPNGDVPIDSPKRRAVPKRKAARQSETALKSQLFEQEDDELDNSDGEVLKIKAAAVETSARRKRNKNGSDPSARARKRAYQQ